MLLFKNKFIQTENGRCFHTSLANFLNNQSIIDTQKNVNKGTNINIQKNLLEKYSFKKLSFITLQYSFIKPFVNLEIFNLLNENLDSENYFVYFVMVNGNENNTLHSLTILKNNDINNEIYVLDPNIELSYKLNIDAFFYKYEVKSVSIVTDVNGNPQSFNSIFLKHLQYYL